MRSVLCRCRRRRDTSYRSWGAVRYESLCIRALWVRRELVWCAILFCTYGSSRTVSQCCRERVLIFHAFFSVALCAFSVFSVSTMGGGQRRQVRCPGRSLTQRTQRMHREPQSKARAVLLRHPGCLLGFTAAPPAAAVAAQRSALHVHALAAVASKARQAAVLRGDKFKNFGCTTLVRAAN
jgi:hypothetical protein